MKKRKRVYIISHERAVEIAMNHNAVSKEIAEKYTDTELKEILYHLKIDAKIKK